MKKIKSVFLLSKTLASMRTLSKHIETRRLIPISM